VKEADLRPLQQQEGFNGALQPEAGISEPVDTNQTKRLGFPNYNPKTSEPWVPLPQPLPLSTTAHNSEKPASTTSTYQARPSSQDTVLQKPGGIAIRMFGIGLAESAGKHPLAKRGEETYDSIPALYGPKKSEKLSLSNGVEDGERYAQLGRKAGFSLAVKVPESGGTGTFDLGVGEVGQAVVARGWKRLKRPSSSSKPPLLEPQDDKSPPSPVHQNVGDKESESTAREGFKRRGDPVDNNTNKRLKLDSGDAVGREGLGSAASVPSQPLQVGA
jgi:hypothetical protein